MPNLNLFLGTHPWTVDCIKSLNLFQSRPHTLTHHGHPAVHAGLALHRRDLSSSVRPSSSWPLSSSRTTRPSVNYFNSDNAISTDFHAKMKCAFLHAKMQTALILASKIATFYGFHLLPDTFLGTTFGAPIWGCSRAEYEAE